MGSGPAVGLVEDITMNYKSSAGLMKDIQAFSWILGICGVWTVLWHSAAFDFFW